MTETLLKIDSLQIEYRGKPPTRAVDRVTLHLAPGENLGLVGESGCGKTTIARAILGLLPRTGSVVGGRLIWEGQDITHHTQAQWSRLRWAEIAIVPQSAMNSLDPVYRMRDQIAEAIQAHELVSRHKAYERAEALCRLVGIEPRRLMDYPHQLSGGMKQRLVIAMALALGPKLIIADEPTTALDVIVQDRILEQVIELQQKLGFAMIYISHDIAVIAETCQKVAVMYAGQIVEYGSTREVLKQPAHPYAMGLKNSFPDLRQPRPLISIPGHPPNLAPPPGGCRFAQRCPFATDFCISTEPPLIEVAPGHLSACHYADQAAELRQRAVLAATWVKAAALEEEAAVV
jgi:oligopeptide/dipeptide ABC transporter ATP-binding protein